MEIFRVSDFVMAQEAKKQFDLTFQSSTKSVKILEQYQELDADGAINFLFSGFVHVGLPHRKLKEDEVWSISTDRANMVINPAKFEDNQGNLVSVGVPYGSKARLIMIYLQTEALRTNNREIELGKSLNSWLRKMNIPLGGKSIADVKMQAERISHCLFTFSFKGENFSGFRHQTIVDTGIFSNGERLLECVRLSETFYEQLKKHPTPIEEAAIRALSGNSQALDIYCWLAYRLHALNAPVSVSWAGLKAQFGHGVARMTHFKSNFMTNLVHAQTVYPLANITVGKEGMILRPSPPPVSKTLI